MVDDCRANVTGGLLSGIDIWEIAVIPYLLNNSETWDNLPTKAVEMLDDLQNKFLRSQLETPRTCPTPALLWEIGMMSMENRIIKKKLNFFHHLLHLPQDCLAWEVAQLQAKLSLPGLVEERTTLIKMMELPDPGSCTKLQ